MWARVTAGQCEHAVCCRATTTQENTVAMTRERIEDRDGEGWVMKEGQFAAEEKRVYTFAERGEGGNNRWVSCLQFSAPNQTSSEITLYSQQRWSQAKHETEALLHTCAPAPSWCLFMFFLLHFLLHSYAVHIKGWGWMSCLPSFQQNIFLSGTRGKLR